MKKIFTLIAAMLLVPWVGWGQEETIKISTAEDLYTFAERVEKGEASLNAVLVNSIVINENVLNEDGLLNAPVPENEWEFTIRNYSGTFDGNNETISGLYSRQDALFNSIAEGGVVKNLGIKDSYFGGAKSMNGASFSIFTFTNKGTISNCWNEGTLEGKIDGSQGGGASGLKMGIICSTNEGVVENCYNKGLFISSFKHRQTSSAAIGGLCGTSSGTIKNSYNEGELRLTIEGMSSVNGTASYSIGGVVGIAYNLQYCYNNGEINIVGGEIENQTITLVVGGVVGSNTTDMSSCYNTGSLTIENLNISQMHLFAFYGLGGVSGMSYGFEFCYNKGQINAKDQAGCAGNIIGIASSEDVEASNTYYQKFVENAGNILDLSTGTSFLSPISITGTTEKEEAAFLSGEVAWLLYKGGYGQRIGTDKHPVLINLGNEGTEVYKLNLTSDDISEEADYPTFVNHGTEITPFKDLTLEEGQTINWYKDGERVAEGLTYTVDKADADEDAVINLTAKIENEYTITTDIQPADAGIIEVAEKAQEGDEISFKVVSNEGYKQGHVSAATDAGEAIALTENEGTYTFTMPAANVTITATFEKTETGGDDDDEGEGGIGTKRYQLFLADQDFYLNDEYDAEGLVLYSLHDKRYTKAGSSFTVWFEKHGEVNEGARVFISNRANGEYKEVKLDEVSGYYQIRNVQSNIYVKLYTEEGFPVANESIEATDARAYAQANKIVVITPEPTDVQIISMAGAVVATAQVAGQQEFANLAEGVYIVRMGKEIVKLQVRN